MASSRQTRGDISNGLRPPTVEYPRSLSTTGSPSIPNYDSYDTWEEPTPRNPVPSFEDYKGYERQGVLEHMQPLGTLPSAKVRARLKQHEGPRRAAPPRASGRHFQEEVPPASFPAAQSTPYYRTYNSGHQPLHVLDTPQEYDAEPAMNGIVSDAFAAPPLAVPESQEHSPATPRIVSQPQAAPSMPLSNPFPFKPQALRYKPIVDHAIRKANENGKYAVAIALQKIYQEALQDPVYLSLMQSVLSNEPNEATQTAFAAYIKAAKKEAKRDNPNLRHSARSSASSHKRSLSTNVNSFNNATSPETSQIKKTTRNSSRALRDTPSKTPGLRTTNGSPSKAEPVKKKVKRSASTSTDSSLSSVNSDIERFAPSNIDPALSKPNTRTDGLRVVDNQLLTPNIESTAINGLHTNDDTPEARLSLRKRQLQGRHQPTIRTSAIRSPVASPRRSQTPLITVQQRSPKPRRGRRELRSNVNDNVESSDSPLSSQDEDIPPPPYAVRGATPQPSRLPKAMKKAARIKQSPLKKRSGVTAGSALSTEPESHHTGTGRAEDNIAESELCCACSGNGSLILCDGCPRGFHFTCCDPPLNPEIALDDLPEQWYCHKCKNAPPHHEARKSTGIWKDLHQQMQSKNPMAFRLPNSVRDYFEGIITGEEGEYEELPTYKLSKARTGYEESPDNFRIKDRKDNTILCSRCGGSASGKQEIIPCDSCSLHWHLDCIDPPLANAPNRKPQNGKPRPPWVCPNHGENDLQHMTATKDPGHRTIRKPAASQLEEKTRIFKTRRPKHPTIIDIGLRRGFRNHGLIEVIESSSDEESEIEREMSGAIYRVPERGIKLDFIYRIKQSNFEAEFYERSMQQAAAARTSSGRATDILANDSSEHSRRQAFDQRPFRDRQAALNLQQLAQGDNRLNADSVVNLIQTLTAEAPPGVTSLHNSQDDHEVSTRDGKKARGNGVSEQERQDLEALIKLAQRRLQMPRV